MSQEDAQQETTDEVSVIDGQEPSSTTDDEGQAPASFDAEYVKSLRAEAATNRSKLREAEARLKEFEDRDKTELERITERADTAEQRASNAERELTRFRVAAEVGLPPELAARLRGDDEEAMRADADELMKLVPATTPPPGSYDNGAAEPGETDSSMDALIRTARR